MFNILIVCDGNTCRSPMTHVFMADLLTATGCDEKLSIDIAGIRAKSDQPPTENAIKVMKKRGFDIAHFKAKPVNESLVEVSDLVLVMTKLQKEEIKKNFSHIDNLKVITLVEASQIAKSFRSIARQNKFLDTDSRLRSIAELGDMDSVLEITDEGKAFLSSVSLYPGKNIDIFDPFGGDLEAYERCASIIQKHVEEIVSFICEGENIC